MTLLIMIRKKAPLSFRGIPRGFLKKLSSVAITSVNVSKIMTSDDDRINTADDGAINCDVNTIINT